MQVTMNVPDEVLRALADPRGDVERSVLEALAAEGYRRGTLSESDLVRILGFESRFDVHQWLADREIPLQYGERDLRDDLATLSELGLR